MTSDLARRVGALAGLFRVRLVVVGALAALNLAVFLALLQPAMDAATTDRHAAARAAARARAGETAARARAGLLETRRRADAYAAGFPARSELLALTSRIQRAARRLALKVPAMDYRPDARPAPGVPLERVAIAMRVEGPYGDVRRLLYEVEALGRRLVVDALALRGRAADGTVHLALELSAYTRLTAVPGGASGAPPPRPSALAPRPGAPSGPAIEVPAFAHALLDLPRAPYRKEARNLFADRAPPARPAPTPPPRAAAAPAALPSPEPVAAPTPAPPPDPFYEEARQLRLLGTARGKDGPRAVVSRGAEVLLVRANDPLGARYVVKDVRPDALVLRSPAGDKEVVLFLKEVSGNEARRPAP